MKCGANSIPKVNSSNLQFLFWAIERLIGGGVRGLEGGPNYICFMVAFFGLGLKLVRGVKGPKGGPKYICLIVALLEPR